MIFELSRDYKRAFELIKKGDRVVCLVDYGDCRDVAIARIDSFGELTIGARGIGYSHFFRDQVEVDELFLVHCDRLNVEFYLPLPDNMLVISTEKVEEIATKVLLKTGD